MRIAIPTWDGRISPVFDVARRLLLVDVDGNAEVGRSEVELEEMRMVARTARLTSLGVQVLVCGAISMPFEAMLTSAGVRVLPQVCGSVDDVLRAYLAGQLAGDAFLMPGCCGRRRRFRGGRGGGLGRGRGRGMA